MYRPLSCKWRASLAASLYLAACAMAAFPQTPDLDALTLARGRVARDRSLNQEESRQILELYDAAVRALSAAQQSRSAQTAQEKRRVALQREIETIGEQLLQTPKLPPDSAEPDETPVKVEESLERAQVESNAQTRILNDLSKADADLVRRRDEISQRRGRLRLEEETAGDSATGTAIPLGSDAWQSAASAYAAARKQAFDAERELLQAEARTLDVLGSLIPLRRDRARLQIEALDQLLERLKTRSRNAQARQARQELDRATAIANGAAGLAPSLKLAAAQVVDLSQRLWGSGGLFLHKQEVALSIERLRRDTLRVDAASDAMRRRYAAAEPLAPASEWLHGIPMDLPRLPAVEAGRRNQAALLARIRRDTFALEDRRQAEPTLESQIEAIREEWARAGYTPAASAEADARRLLQLRRDLTEDLLKASQELDNQLTEIDQVSASLIRKLTDTRTFAEQRVLWTRSVSQPLSATQAFLGLRWLAGWRPPEKAAAPDLLATAWRAGSIGSIATLAALLLLLLGARPSGFLARLRGWPDIPRRQFRRELVWLAYLLPPLWFVVSALAAAGGLVSQNPELESYHNSLGRIAFLFTGACLLLALARLFRSGLLQPFAKYLFSLSLVLVPMILALAGFYATAFLFARNLFASLLLTLALSLLEAFLHRRRDLVGDQPSQAQVRRLIRFGLAILWTAGLLRIWQGVAPALTMLDQVRLGAANPPLTLLNLLEALLAATIATVLVRNIPGLVEVLLLRRLRLHTGSIYAVTLILRYLLIVAGAVVVSRIFRLDWSQVQWLAAALTFGVGFGLQEVFANLVSGLILLFDHSIRVGDAVSVGEWSGRVTRIQMRATTVTLWNRSEMVVPNKEFITGKLINWTLSLPESRVDVKVGVAYGSDLDRVRQCLYDVAAANRNVLKQPPPQVLLTGFGENAIMFELQAFCLYDFGRQTMLDELHAAVYRAFADRGVRIAAPRLDVTVRSADKL